MPTLRKSPSFRTSRKPSAYGRTRFAPTELPKNVGAQPSLYIIEARATRGSRIHAHCAGILLPIA
jgi:hypothetical protein